MAGNAPWLTSSARWLTPSKARARRSMPPAVDGFGGASGTSLPSDILVPPSAVDLAQEKRVENGSATLFLSIGPQWLALFGHWGVEPGPVRLGLGELRSGLFPAPPQRHLGQEH